MQALLPAVRAVIFFARVGESGLGRGSYLRYGPRARESRVTIRPPGVRAGYPHPGGQADGRRWLGGMGEGSALLIFRRWPTADLAARAVEK